MFKKNHTVKSCDGALDIISQHGERVEIESSF